MKKILVFLLSLTLLLVGCLPNQQTETPPSLPDLFSTPWEDRSIFRSGLVQSEQAILEELDGASVYHIEFKIAENMYTINGHQDVKYTNTETVALNDVRFRLFPNILGGDMDVSNIAVDGGDVTPDLQLNNSLLIVPLASPLEPGGSVVIGMDFMVEVPREVELNYGVLAYFDDVLALAHAYPMIAVYDDEGWNAELPPQSGDVTYADASFFLVRISAPEEVTVVASGTVTDRTVTGETRILNVVSGPARDFYLAASPAYEEITETFGEVTIRSYAPNGFEEGARVALDTAAKSIETFSERYAPYPYTEFDIVSTPTLALGIEYPGITAITSRIYDLDGEINGTPLSVYLESTVAHEVGHQWFYNLVGVDQLDDPWLDESLTQFITLQYYADQYGPGGEQGYRSSLEGRWETIGRAEIPVGLPVAKYQGNEYSAIVYGRGALFFLELREEMGTAAFDAFLKDYTEMLSWDIATPDFLQSLAEEHCACDLDALFNEWIYP